METVDVIVSSDEATEFEESEDDDIQFVEQLCQFVPSAVPRDQTKENIIATINLDEGDDDAESSKRKRQRRRGSRISFNEELIVFNRAEVNCKFEWKESYVLNVIEGDKPLVLHCLLTQLAELKRGMKRRNRRYTLCFASSRFEVHHLSLLLTKLFETCVKKTRVVEYTDQQNCEERQAILDQLMSYDDGVSVIVCTENLAPEICHNVELNLNVDVVICYNIPKEAEYLLRMFRKAGSMLGRGQTITFLLPHQLPSFLSSRQADGIFLRSIKIPAIPIMALENIYKEAVTSIEEIITDETEKTDWDEEESEADETMPISLASIESLERCCRREFAGIQIVQKYLEEHYNNSEWVHIFTKGTMNGTGWSTASYRISCIFFDEIETPAENSTLVNVEMSAIARAAEKVAEYKCFPRHLSKFVIFTDSKAAAEFIVSHEICRRNEEDLTHYRSLRSAVSTIWEHGHELKIQWIPSRCQIFGTGKVEELPEDIRIEFHPPNKRRLEPPSQLIQDIVIEEVTVQSQEDAPCVTEMEKSPMASKQIETVDLDSEVEARPKERASNLGKVLSGVISGAKKFRTRRLEKPKLRVMPVRSCNKRKLEEERERELQVKKMRLAAACSRRRFKQKAKPVREPTCSREKIASGLPEGSTSEQSAIAENSGAAENLLPSLPSAAKLARKARHLLANRWRKKPKQSGYEGPYFIAHYKDNFRMVASIDGVMGNVSKQKKKDLTELHIQKNYNPTEWVHIYSDGSYKSKQGGYGLYCKYFEKSVSLPMSSLLSSDSAEFAGILSAAEIVANCRGIPPDKSKFVILSDSYSAIDLISNSKKFDQHPDNAAFKESLALITEHNLHLEFQWIPGHCGIVGNEKADKLAKEGREKQSFSAKHLKDLVMNKLRKAKETLTLKRKEKKKEKKCKDEPQEIPSTSTAVTDSPLPEKLGLNQNGDVPRVGLTSENAMPTRAQPSNQGQFFIAHFKDNFRIVASIEGVMEEVDKCKKKNLTELHLEKHYDPTDWVHIYSAGSYCDNSKQGGYGLHCSFFETSDSLPKSCLLGAEIAEFAGILRAAEVVADGLLVPPTKSKFVILSDSSSAIDVISNADRFELHPESRAIKEVLATIAEHEHHLEFQWIPGDCGIEGSEKAYELAKEARDKQPDSAKHLKEPVMNKLTKVMTNLALKKKKKKKKKKPKKCNEEPPEIPSTSTTLASSLSQTEEPDQIRDALLETAGTSASDQLQANAAIQVKQEVLEDLSIPLPEQQLLAPTQNQLGGSQLEVRRVRFKSLNWKKKQKRKDISKLKELERRHRVLKVNNFQMVIHIDGLEGIVSDQEVNILTKLHLERHYKSSDWVYIYCEGSFCTEKNLGAYSLYCSYFEEAASLPKSRCSSLKDAEVAGIIRAAEIVAEFSVFPLDKKNFVILSESLMAIRLICRSNLSGRHRPEAERQAFITKLNIIDAHQHQLLYQYIPIKCGMEGKEKAELLAKKMTELPSTPGATLHFQTSQNTEKSEALSSSSITKN